MFTWSLLYYFRIWRERRWEFYAYFAVGRKNWLFSNTPRGAECSAALYSIVSTAHANCLDAEKYLTEQFRQPSGTIIMPWREEKKNGIS